MTTDSLNPKFVFLSPVRHGLAAGAEELIEYVDHAIIALDARAPIGGSCAIEQLSPVLTSDSVRVDLWVNDLGDYTCTYGFLVSSEDGRVPYARGERSVVSAGAKPWSRDFRSTHLDLMKDLPAFA
jgi:acyl-CoA thioesterase FadM